MMKKNLVFLLMVLAGISAKAQWDVSSAPVLYRWADNTQTILKTTRSDGSFEGRLEADGSGGFNFTNNLWVIGQNFKLGKLDESYIEGLDIQYTDGGHGTTTFLHKRWGGNFWFKHESEGNGIVNQFYFGGLDPKMEIYNSANQVNVSVSSVGISYFNGGNVGIGTTNPQSLLAVNGKITAKEVQVTLTGWPDFVFKKDYKLTDLSEVEQFIKMNNHLPEIPSEKEVYEDGVELGAMQAKLLQKIEELTLYTIEQEKKLDAQNKLLKNQQKAIKELQEKMK